jgi:hypothetical protein
MEALVEACPAGAGYARRLAEGLMVLPLPEFGMY